MGTSSERRNGNLPLTKTVDDSGALGRRAGQWLARARRRADARPVDDGQTTVDASGALGVAPAVGDDDRGAQVAKRNIHESLFPEVGSTPVHIGRFELLRRLGQGGMGDVYVAYDEQLDREVALKLLLPERAGDRSAQDRLLREAQVLARLSHPNVVQIHEAGVHEGQVYLVMELVEGITLRKWFEQPPKGARVRPWAEVLPVMIAAGRGLAAAHAAGLTHRDFKPANVLVGRDGRVRVLDFGLARPGDPEDRRIVDPDEVSAEDLTVSTDGPPSADNVASGSRREIEQLTRPGRVMGTMAYMSPEQLSAQPVDARSDQFSFCVTLYEALYGVRPFEGRTVAGLMVAVTEGQLQPPVAKASVPRWLRALTMRGLAVQPDQRFADMEALLRELSRSRGRLRTLAVGAGLVGLGGVAVAAALVPSEPCAQADAELAKQWNDEARARVRTAFAAAEPSYGEDAAQRVVAALDGRVDAWRAEQRDACEDTRVRQTHPEGTLAERTACIERATTDLRALLRALPEADASLVEHALEIVNVLPQPVRCQDLDALGPQAPEDPAAVRGVREAVAAARVARMAGHDERARALGDEAREQAEASGYGPAKAEALVESARVRLASSHDSDKDAARDMLWQALDLAELHEHRGLLFDIWLDLLSSDDSRGNYDRARLWARRADVARQRSPGESRRRLQLAARRGVTELRAGNLRASETILREGLRASQGQADAGLERAYLFEALGNTLRRTERVQEAQTAYEEAGRLWRAAFGPEHPYLARHDYNFGVLLTELGQADAADPRLRHAHARWLELYGARARLVGQAELALAQVAQLRGDLDKAHEHVARAQEIFAATAQPGDPFQVQALEMLGLVQFWRADYQAAHDSWQQALEHIVAAHGSEHPEALRTRSNIAETLLYLGQHDRAQQAYEALLPLVQARAEQEPVTLMLVLKGLGLAELGAQRPAAAVEPLRGALVLLDGHGGLPLERADVLWALARAQRGAGQGAAAVRDRAELAAGIYVEHGQADRADEVREWLAVVSR